MNDDVTCANCGRAIAAYQAHVFDDHADNTHCDNRCFDDWAAANAQLITEFYRSLNVQTAD